jgi:hypothetical protein
VIREFLVDLNGIGCDGGILVLEKGVVQCVTLFVSQF